MTSYRVHWLSNSFPKTRADFRDAWRSAYDSAWGDFVAHSSEQNALNEVGSSDSRVLYVPSSSQRELFTEAWIKECGFIETRSTEFGPREQMNLWDPILRVIQKFLVYAIGGGLGAMVRHYARGGAFGHFSEGFLLELLVGLVNAYSKFLFVFYSLWQGFRQRGYFDWRTFREYLKVCKICKKFEIEMADETQNLINSSKLYSADGFRLCLDEFFLTIAAIFARAFSSEIVGSFKGSSSKALFGAYVISTVAHCILGSIGLSISFWIYRGKTEVTETKIKTIGTLVYDAMTRTGTGNVTSALAESNFKPHNLGLAMLTDGLARGLGPTTGIPLFFGLFYLVRALAVLYSAALE